MTERSAASLLDLYEGLGVLFLWFVIVIRAVPAVRQRNQRTMWLAVLCGAFAMSLRIAPVYGLATRMTGLSLGEARDIIADVVGLFAAAAIFAFVLNVVGRGKYSSLAYGAAVVVAVVLILIDRYYDARTSTGLSQHTAAGDIYWLILLVYHLIANFWCAYICWGAAPRARTTPLKSALLIFAVGTGMAGLLMVLSLVHFFTHIHAIVYFFPVVQGTEAFLYGLGTAVPLITALARAGRESLWLSRIYPLWQDLTNVVEEITLTTPATYLAYLALSRVNQSRGLYRRVIEIQDGILTLYRWVDPKERSAAANFAQTRGLRDDHLDAATTACCLGVAIQRKAEGRTPLPGDEVETRWETDLFAEAAHLHLVSRFYRSALPRDFIRDLDPQPARA